MIECTKCHGFGAMLGVDEDKSMCATCAGTGTVGDSLVEQLEASLAVLPRKAQKVAELTMPTKRKPASVAIVEFGSGKPFPDAAAATASVTKRRAKKPRSRKQLAVYDRKYKLKQKRARAAARLEAAPIVAVHSAPRRPRGKALGTQFLVRIDPADLAVIKARADRMGISASDLMRKAAMGEPL